MKRRVLSSRRAIVACHHNADPDAVCSAFALSKLLRKLRRGLRVSLVAPEGVSEASRRALKAVPASFLEWADPKRVDLIFLVDTGTLTQLGDFGGELAGLKKPLVVVDHHAIHPSMRRLKPLFLVDEKATSTSEIIYGLYERLNVKLGRVEAQALMVGMAFDTKHFAVANFRTFLAAAGLCKAGAKPEAAAELLKAPLGRPERIARLKAAQRVELKEVGGWIIALSNVSSFQASAARAIVALGADLAVVGGEKKGELRISLRCSNEFCEGTGVHLGRDVAIPLGKFVGGMGSGHALAAGVNGRGNLNEALERSITLISDILKKRL